MCGIGGILRTDGQPIPEEWLDAIDARIAYRGPDGAGRFRDRVTFTDEQGRQRIVEVAFVHRRLSIIDHKDGHQPMVSERGRNENEGLVAVVFNGCIYNHRELRKELEAKGHRFVTDHSDTEVLIHGWREWREGLPGRLEGMYAFAIWDRIELTLFIARDLYGEKPLYEQRIVRDEEQYSLRYVFCSDRFAVLPAIDELRMADRLPTLAAHYLQYGHGWSEALDSYKGPIARVVDPGDWHWLGIFRETLGGLGRYPNESVPTTSERIEALLEQAVARRLEADVPLGCFLSGGVDSSLIAHFAKRHRADLKTFTVRMPDARYDESKYAQSVAQHLGTDHHALDVEMNPADDLVHLIDTLGQPFGDSSILPTYWVSKAARQQVKVALAGDGGDELFIGYERYFAARQIHLHYPWFGWMPGWLHRGAHPKSLRSKVARVADVSRDYEQLGVRALEALFTLDELEELVGDSVQLPLMDLAWSKRFTKRFAWLAAKSIGGATDADEPVDEDEEDPLEELRRIDILEYLPQDLLTKTDTASMACGLEVRCPFLDHDLASAVLAMPVDELIPNGERKGLLRRIARKYLPRECVDRPKMGFAIPIGEWLRDDDLPHKGSGMKSLLLDHLNSAEPFGPIQLNRKAVQRFIDEHMSAKRDHGQRLFTLLTLSIWARGTGRHERASSSV